jgi:hypothetical protein
MNTTQAQARHLLARTRQQSQNRRAAMLERSTQEMNPLADNRQALD